MKPNIKIKTSKSLILFLLIGFMSLPLQTALCILNHGTDDDIHHTLTPKGVDNNYFFSQQDSEIHDECCNDSGALFFALDTQKYNKNISINYTPCSNILVAAAKLQNESRFSLEFFVYHFPPPRHNSNKLYKINSALLI